jgi:hypothetical protein
MRDLADAGLVDAGLVDAGFVGGCAMRGLAEGYGMRDLAEKRD